MPVPPVELNDVFVHVVKGRDALDVPLRRPACQALPGVPMPTIRRCFCRLAEQHGITEIHSHTEVAEHGVRSCGPRSPVRIILETP